MRRTILLAMSAVGAMATGLAVSAMLSTYQWESGVSGSWSNAVRWDPDGVPSGAGNTAVINAPGTYTVTLDQNVPALDSFTLDNAQTSFTMDGRTFASDVIAIQSGTINCFNSAVTASTGFSNAGTLNIKGGSNVTGPASNSGLIRVEGNSSYNSGTFTAFTGLSNSGTIDLTSVNGGYGSALSVASNTLVNSGSGILNFLVGSSGPRTFTGRLQNAGTVNVNQPTTFNSAVTHLNTGTLNVSASGGLTLNIVGEVLDQSAGSINALGTLLITNGSAFNFNGGTVNGSTVINGAILNIGPLASGAASFQIFGSSTMSGNPKAATTITIQGNSAVGNANLTAPVGFTNAGLIDLTAANGGYNSALTATTGLLTNTGTLRVSTGSAGARTISADLLNSGTVQLNHNAALSRNNGTYTNVGNFNVVGTLTMSGLSQVFNQNSGTLNVAGAFNVGSAFFNFNGGTILGSPRLADSVVTITPSGIGSVTIAGLSSVAGTIGANKGVTILGDSTSNNASVTATNTLTNDGSINLVSNNGGYVSSLSVTNGQLVNNGTLTSSVGSSGSRFINASLVNTGLVEIKQGTEFGKTGATHFNTGNIIITSGLTMNASGQTFNQDSGTLDCSGGSFTVNNNAFNFNNGTIIGIPKLNNSVVTSTASGVGEVSLHGNSTLGGTIGSNKAVDVIGNSTSNNASVGGSGFVNNGRITMSSTNGGYASAFNIANGTLLSNGEFNVEAGTGGARTIATDFVNNGTMTVNQDLTFGKFNGVYENGGAMDIFAPVTINGSSQVFTQSAGSIFGGDLFSCYSMTFNFNGGTVAGQPRLYSSALNIGPTATGAANFWMGGSGTISGNVKAGQMIDVKGSSNQGNSVMTAATGFSNAGTIVLDSTTGGYSSALSLTSGVLSNSGTLGTSAGTGGSRTIAASVTNTGIVNLNTPTTLNKPGAVCTNSGGNFNVNAVTTVASGGQVFRQTGGNLNVNSSLLIDSAAFDYIGGNIVGVPRLRSSQLSIVASATNAATIETAGSSTLVGNVLTGHQIVIRGNSDMGNATLTSANGFTNAGTMILDSANGGYSSGISVPAGVLTVLPSGQILSNPGVGGGRTIAATFSNAGLMEFNVPTSVGAASATHSNTGTFRVKNNTTVTVTGSALNNVAPGRIEGQGTVSMSGFSNQATVAPGLSAGKLTIAGAFNQGVNGALEVELGGPNQGTTYDWLATTGAVTLNGKMIVRLIDNYDPVAGTEFTVLTAPSVTGLFSSIQLENFPVAKSVELVYGAGFVKVRIKDGASVQPDSYVVTEGFELSGGLLSLLNSDNNRLVIFPDDVTQTSQIEISGTAPFSNPTSLRFAFESSVGRTGLGQSIRLRNFGTNSFTLIDGRIATTTDSLVDTVVSTNAPNFIGPAGLMVAQITWQPINDEDPAQDGWAHNIDRAAWTLIL